MRYKGVIISWYFKELSFCFRYFKGECDVVQYSIVNQIKVWTPPDNCKDGGEKCLYTVSFCNQFEYYIHVLPCFLN